MNIEKWENHGITVSSYYGKYRDFFENKVGSRSRAKILRALRLDDQVRMWLGADGTIYEPDGVGGYTNTGNKDLNFDEVIVETTLPRTAVQVLKTYSVSSVPTIDCGTPEEQNWLNNWFEKNKVHEKMQKLVIDMLVCGNAYFKIERNEKGNASMVCIAPELVSVIPSEFNITEPQAYKIKYNNNDSKVQADIMIEELYLDNGAVIRTVDGAEELIESGLDACGLHHIKGLTDNEDYPLYGESIYKGLESVFVELVERLTSNSYLFNKINNPTMVGAVDLSVRDPETGEEVAQSGKYVYSPESENANSLRYVTPPTEHVNSIYPHLELILKQAYAQLGVNAISLGLSESGSLASGEAYKKAITPTLNKCKEIVNKIKPTMIQAFKQAYYLDTGKELSVTMTFSDGVDLTRYEETQIDVLLADTKILSRRSILAKYGYTEEEAQRELERIAEDERTITNVIDTLNIEDIKNVQDE